MCVLDAVSSHHHVPFHADTKLLSFSRKQKPYRTIESGDEVIFDNTGAGFDKIDPNTTDADLDALSLTGLGDIEKVIGPIYVIGPVYVNGAMPTDILKVEILELHTGSWGWTAVFPGLGLFKDEIPGPHIKTFDLTKDRVSFGPGITLPCQPFYGTMGVAPGDDADAHPLFPRNDIGGNFDCRYLGVGATFYLPINVPGALFSVGDAHYCQGDGEITGTALETTMKSRLRLTVLKGGQQLKSPHYMTSPDAVMSMVQIGGKGEYGVLATASARDVAVKEAVSGLLDWLVETKGLERRDGSMLLSLCGNLKMMHDLGLELFTVSASIPLGIFY